MSEPILCPARTYPATPFEPAEYCTNEVADYGDLCPVHDSEARAEDDYDRYLDSKHD